MAATSDIKRKAELVIVDALKARLPALAIFPSRGGTDENDLDNSIPPFSVVEAQTAEESGTHDGTWTVRMALAYLTEISETTEPVHSENLRALQDALETIPPGYDAEQALRLHGLSISSTYDFETEGKRAHGDVIAFVVGVTG